MNDIFDLYDDDREVSLNIHCSFVVPPVDLFPTILEQTAQPAEIQKTKRQRLIFEKEKPKKQSAKSRMLSLANMIGRAPAMKGRIATPVVRCAVIEDSSRCVIQLRSEDDVKGFGEFATMFNELPAIHLGSGRSSTVFEVEFCGRSFAVKTAKTDETREEMLGNQKNFKMWAAEPRIAAFITEHLIGLKSPTIARCPNFVAQYGYEYTSVIPKLNNDSIMQCSLKKYTAVVTVGEVFDYGTAEEMEKLIEFDLCPLRNEKLAFSMIAQILIAIACLQTIGVSHNDLRLDNIFAHSTTDSALRYQFPSEKIFDPSNMLCINSQSVMFAVGDFGIASCEAWETSGDMRFEKPNLEYGRHATLGTYYFDERQRMARKSGMLCSDWKGNLAHPLMCDLDTRERDISAFLTQVVLDSERLKSFRIAQYARDVLKEFDVEGRLQSAKQIMEITKRVLSPEFTNTRFGDMVASKFYASSDVLPGEHIYFLPNEFDGRYMERELEKLLQEDCQLDSLFRHLKRM